jgi:hypothetical protein
LITNIKYWSGKALAGLICLVTPRCHDMTRLISLEQERPLSSLTKLRMRWHYGICIWCRRYHEQIGLLGKLSRAFPEHSCDHGAPQLSDAAKARLKQALTRAAND